MPDLMFAVRGAASVPFAAVPTIAFDLQISGKDPEQEIHSVMLRCQIQLEVARRHYNQAEQENLRDLFGDPGRWGQTLRSMLWTHASVAVPSFTGSTAIDLPVSCTFDFNVAATKYFGGLEEGEIPLILMFSGTVFFTNAAGHIQVAPISWDKECRYRLPVSVWKEMMDEHYPNTAWLCLRRDAFERLHEYKIRHGIPTWEEAIEKMLDEQEAVRQ